jgi:hypothetical protein
VSNINGSLINCASPLNYHPRRPGLSVSAIAFFSWMRHSFLELLV